MRAWLWHSGARQASWCTRARLARISSAARRYPDHIYGLKEDHRDGEEGQGGGPRGAASARAACSPRALPRAWGDMGRPGGHMRHTCAARSPTRASWGCALSSAAPTAPAAAPTRRPQGKGPSRAPALPQLADDDVDVDDEDFEFLREYGSSAAFLERLDSKVRREVPLRRLPPRPRVDMPPRHGAWFLCSCSRLRDRQRPCRGCSAARDAP